MSLQPGLSGLSFLLRRCGAVDNVRGGEGVRVVFGAAKLRVRGLRRDGYAVRHSAARRTP